MSELDQAAVHEWSVRNFGETPQTTWDQGDDEPTGVTFVLDYTAPTASEFDEDSAQWGRTTGGEWKGYKNGGKVYLDWPELVRRWGPLTAPEVSR